MNELLLLNYKLLSLSIFSNILKDSAIASLMGLFAYSSKSLSESVIYAAKFLKIIYESEYRGDFSKYLNDLIMHDENVFTKNIARSVDLNDDILNAAKQELSTLSELFAFDMEKIKQILKTQFKDSENIVDLLGKYGKSENCICFDELCNYLRQNCYGIYAKYGAFFYKEGKINPVKHTDVITFEDLKDYKTQQETLIKNTHALIEGKGANNILLYGDRGCGKSSSVKATYNEFKNQGLKIVQILKQDLSGLDNLLEKLAKIPSKFIVFIDDLSFSQEDENLSVIKSALEGAISKRSDNVVIYATTNRRNIIKETFSSREGNEVHLSDTIDENASLSDRFGITLTFLAPNKDKFLEIAKKIAKDKNIEIKEDFDIKAERFALLKASRSPRVAQQFVKQYSA